MSLLSKHLNNNNLMLKGVSCILALLVWLKVTHNHIVEWECNMPIFFYNMDEQQILGIPEYVTARMQGMRQSMYLCSQDAYALHIDGQTLHKGSNTLNLATAAVHLPDSVKLLDYSPSDITVFIE